MTKLVEPVVKASIDDFLQNSPIGAIKNAIGNNFYGINHTQTPTAIPINKDNYGLTFFVRPQLNLSTDNIRNARLFIPLLTKQSLSIQRIIRCYLDPRLAIGNNEGGREEITCPYVDNEQAFIPILTNHLKSVSGWPDLSLDTMTSKQGAYRDEHAMVDSVAVNYSAYDIEATFRNSKGSPILLLFHIWEHYQALVYEGILVPYPDFIVENEIDYMTRIYRLVLDPTKRFVQAIGSTGVSFPTSLPIGAVFNYSNEKPYNDANNDITIRFKCLGAQYQDDILIHEFNKTVAVFNSSMKKSNFKDTRNANGEIESTNSLMVKIPYMFTSYFRNRGYARICPANYELQWWVSKEDFDAKINAITNFNKTFNITS